MRILLIDILRTSMEEVWPSAEHSLGLMYLASAVRQRFGAEISIRIWTLVSKPNHSEIDRQAVLEELARFAPGIVGIRTLTIGKDALRLVAQTAKDWDPACLVVAGGPYATDEPEGVLASGFVDCAVIGEGESTFNAFVERVLCGRPWTDLLGIAYQRDEDTIRNPPRPVIENLDTLPFPDYTLVDPDQFSNQFLTFTSKISKPHANIMTTRGCPYRCAYCHNILGKRFRARSPENVLAEIRHLHDTHGFTDFQIIDDIFNLDIERARTICDLLAACGVKLTFSFPNAIRGDRVDERLIAQMAAAGTKFISYAVETASPRLQKLIRKNLDLDRVMKAIEWTTAAGIVTRGFFMVGFPTETEDEVVQTIDFAKASALGGATFFTVVYFPGTELYRLAQSLGYFRGAGYEVQRDYVNVGEGPYAFDLETLIRLKKRAIREFAFTRERIDQALRMLPAYFSPREIDGFFMAYVVSSGMSFLDVEDEEVRGRLKRYFAVAERFSRKDQFYV